MHLRADLRDFDLRSLGTKFDVILIDPPWEEYARRAAPHAAGRERVSVWSYDEIASLPIEDIGQCRAVLPGQQSRQVVAMSSNARRPTAGGDLLCFVRAADTPSFIFLWCGSGGRLAEDVDRGSHLDDGRKLLKKWG
jgi:hypothetical protein